MVQYFQPQNSPPILDTFFGLFMYFACFSSKKHSNFTDNFSNWQKITFRLQCDVKAGFERQLELLLAEEVFVLDVEAAIFAGRLD